MNRKAQILHTEKFHKKMKETILSKGDDYSNEDRLSNFKLVAAMTGISPQRVVLVMASTKIARLSNLIDSDEVNNESINDSYLDLANYAMLGDALSKEV